MPPAKRPVYLRIFEGRGRFVEAFECLAGTHVRLDVWTHSPGWVHSHRQYVVLTMEEWRTLRRLPPLRSPSIRSRRPTVS